MYTKFRRYSQKELRQKKQDLKAASQDSAVQVKSVGRRFWIFPDYRIAIKPMDLTIKTNVPQADVLLNQKKLLFLIQNSSQSSLIGYQRQNIPQVSEANTTGETLKSINHMMVIIPC